MATNVIAFPPIGAIGSLWTVAAPVLRSQSMITGRRYVSRWGLARREAAVTVSALAKDRSGAGYSEMLIRHLDGGANLVRLNSYPINWHLDDVDLKGVRSAQRLLWDADGNPLTWETGGQTLIWFSGSVLTGTVSGNVLTVSGLPPNRLICRVGDHIELFSGVDSASGGMTQATSPGTSDENGVAVIALFDPIAPGAYGWVNIGASDSRVFEALEMPRAMQPVDGNWFYEWRFREVFADEVGGFTEVNPWVVS